MKKVCISKDWFFSGENGFEPCDLPHDYQVKQRRDPDGNPSNGYFPDKSGKYIKYLKLPTDRHFILDFDGAYMCSRVYFNENLLKTHPYGYTPFLVDITPYILDGITNKLGVSVSPLQGSSRWYTGNGIYRDVFLWEGGSTRIEPWDIFVSTVKVEDDNADICVKYSVSSDTDAKFKVNFKVIFNNEVCQTVVEEHEASFGKNDYETVIKVSSPKLWDIDSPNLYTLQTEIEVDGEITDTTETVFGIKTVEVSAKTGLLLNGKSIKLKGGCIHHDNGELGAAAFPAAEERKIVKLKNAGFNAIRTAHNPPSSAMLEACDKHGIIVMDEAFDMWNLPNNINDYSLFFNEWWASDIAAMVLRDRNHPSVFSYSIGNEINEINMTSFGAEISKKLCDEVRKYDDTKLVTSALAKLFARNSSFESSPTDPEDYTNYIKKKYRDLTDAEVNKVIERFQEPFDIVGANYYFRRYNMDVEMYPDRVLWGSETRVLTIYDSWAETLKYNNVIGDFTWTAIDNLGEAGAGRAFWARDTQAQTDYLPLYGVTYPWRNCYQGDFDLCGFRRPQSYYRQLLWNENTDIKIFVTHPEHFGERYIGTSWHFQDVYPSWTYDDCYVGCPVKAEVYTYADRVEWFVNDRFIGESVPEKCVASIETVYEKGSIKAIAYKNGEIVSQDTLFTTDKASRIIATPEKSEIVADRRDLCYIPVSITDKDGREVLDAEQELTCHVYKGKLLAFFSGNPKSEDDVNSDRCHTFNGKALAIVSADNIGEMTVTFHGEGLAGHTVKIRKVEAIV